MKSNFLTGVGVLCLTHLLRRIEVLYVHFLIGRAHMDSKQNCLSIFSFRLFGITWSREFLKLGQGDVIKSIMKTVSPRELIHHGRIKLDPL